MATSTSNRVDDRCTTKNELSHRGLEGAGQKNVQRTRTLPSTLLCEEEE
jgi:hypothetical protein